MIIPTAKNAYLEARHRSEVEKIKNDIASVIEDNVRFGHFWCDVVFSTDTKDYVRDTIRKEMQDLGYEINIPPYEKTSDPSIMWDVMKIKWENVV